MPASLRSDYPINPLLAGRPVSSGLPCTFTGLRSEATRAAGLLPCVLLWQEWPGGAPGSKLLICVCHAKHSLRTKPCCQQELP